MTRSSVLSALLALVAAGCGAEGSPAADPEAAPGAPPGHGQIVVAIAAVEAAGAGLTVRVRFIEESSQQTIEREQPFAGTAIYEHVYLPQGTYGIEVTIGATDGQLLASGTTAGVLVRPGKTTYATVTLATAGAVQVVARVKRSGYRFKCKGPITIPSFAPVDGTPTQFLGAQRTHPDPAKAGATQYVAFYVDSAATPDDWWVATTTVVGPDGPQFTEVPKVVYPSPASLFQTTVGITSTCTAVTAVGSVFYAMCSGAEPTVRNLYRSNAAGTAWTLHAVVREAATPTTKIGSVVKHDKPLGCVLLADNQLNAFCGVLDAYAVSTSYGLAPTAQYGLFHGWSRTDGRTWEDFPPVSLSAADNPDGKAPNIGVMAPAAGNLPLLAALDGGLYRVWSVTADLVDDPIDFLDGERMVLLESSDRVEWYRQEVPVTWGGCGQLLTGAAGGFVTPSGVHIYGAGPGTPDSFWHLASDDVDL